MKETIFKSLILSLLITNIWSIVAFFIYFYESKGWFYGWETLFFYFWSCWITSALGIIVILISFIKKWITAKLKIFLLVIISWLNSFFSILLLVLTVLEIIRLEAVTGFYLISNLIVSIVALLIIKRILKTS